MVEQNTSDQAVTEKKKWPWPIIVIAALTAFWMIGPYVAYYTGWFVPTETNNKGVLIKPPVHLGDLLQEPLPPQLQDNQWHLLIPVTGACADDCEQNIYTTRQVHIRLSNRGERVQRVAVNLAGAEGEATIAGLSESHPLLTSITVAADDWREWVSVTNLPEINDQHFYLLVHPAGHAILYYTADHHGNELLQDIKHGLKVTPE